MSLAFHKESCPHFSSYLAVGLKLRPGKAPLKTDPVVCTGGVLDAGWGHVLGRQLRNYETSATQDS